MDSSTAFVTVSITIADSEYSYRSNAVESNQIMSVEVASVDLIHMTSGIEVAFQRRLQEVAIEFLEKVAAKNAETKEEESE